MGKLDTFRKVMALPEVIQNVELTIKLKEIYTDYLELLEKNNELNSQLRDFEEISNIKKNAKINSGFYTISEIKDIKGKEIPFCLNCLYEHRLQIPMMYGIIERGTMEAFSGETIIPNLFGLICRKCDTKLVTNGKENGNG